jgi:hypothetical protein
MKFCPSCGQKLESNIFKLDDLSEPADAKGPRAGIVAVQNNDNLSGVTANEPVYYSDEHGLYITSSLVVIPGKTGEENSSAYSLADITAVKSEKDISARIIGAVGVAFGVVMIIARNFANFSAAVSFGIVLIVFGVLLMIFMRPSYHLKLAGANGEIQALKTSRKQELDSIIAAINQAIGKRG